MKRSLRYICAALALACCLVSCSGHVAPPAPPAVRETAEASAAPQETANDSLAALLALSPWGTEEELILNADGSGEYLGQPLSWQRKGILLYLRLLPDSCGGRTLKLILDDSGPALSLCGSGLVLPMSLSTNPERARLERLEQRRLSYLAVMQAQGEQMSQLALSFVGGKYKYGGKSPETGFDCSGLIWYLYDQFGYNLERVAAQQAKQGVHVEPEELIPGDLLAFHTSGSYVGHVGLYVGKGHYVHAMGEAYGIVLTALDDPYLKRDFEGRRLLGQPELMKAPPEDYVALMFPELAAANAAAEDTAG